MQFQRDERNEIQNRKAIELKKQKQGTIKGKKKKCFIPAY